MDENNKIVKIGIVILIVLLVALAVYYLIFAGRGKAKQVAEPSPQAQKAAGEKAPVETGINLAALSVELDKSDDPVRNLLAELSSNPTFGQWLKTKELIRKFVASVDNIANGQSPRAHLDFFALGGEFKTVFRNGRTYLDPSCYDRYKNVADIFVSTSSTGCARMYGSFKPLFQQAYRELGYPKEDFHQTLLRAIVEILKTPVVHESIALEKKIISYAMADPKLEELSLAQKHLLRMGPENLQLIQAKLREIALALGFTENELPRPIIYQSGRR